MSDQIAAVLRASIQKKLGNVTPRRVNQLIAQIASDELVSRRAAAMLLARKLGINFSRFATADDRAEMRGHAVSQTQIDDAPSMAYRAPPLPKESGKPAVKATKNNTLFVVHGRDTKLNEDMFGLLLLAAVVSGFVSFLTSERRLASENIIQERTKWRERVRCLAEESYSAILRGESDTNNFRELRAKLALRLNPHDASDQEILALVAQGDAVRADEFNQRIALLLKHDWERARREGNLWLLGLTKAPRRVSFQNFRTGHPHSYRRWRWFVRMWRPSSEQT